MEQMLQWFEQYGLWGLFFLSFIESFISPILPDVMLIPMALAEPGQAITYSAIVTAASVLGGFIGYGIGSRFGQQALQRFVPPRYTTTLQQWLHSYGGWAIFLAALAPIPYKFVSIAAGTFRISLAVFVLASVLGRGKRFLLIGILIYYFGPQALEMLAIVPDEWLLAGLGVGLLGVIFYAYWRSKKQRSRKNSEN